jgi:hypothetical protein
MKKILVLSIVLLGVFLISCSSLSRPPESSIEPTPFEGVWMREDGATYTFTGNYVEYLDMTNGVAAHGLFRYNTSEDEKDRQIIIYLPGNPVQLMYLKMSNWFYEKPSEFIRNAFYEYKTNRRTDLTAEEVENFIADEQNGIDPVSYANMINELPIAGKKDERKWCQTYGSGAIVQDYALDGDILTIKNSNRDIHTKWYSLLDGQFVRQ